MEPDLRKAVEDETMTASPKKTFIREERDRRSLVIFYYYTRKVSLNPPVPHPKEINSVGSQGVAF